MKIPKFKIMVVIALLLCSIAVAASSAFGSVQPRAITTEKAKPPVGVGYTELKMDVLRELKLNFATTTPPNVTSNTEINLKNGKLHGAPHNVRTNLNNSPPLHFAANKWTPNIGYRFRPGDSNEQHTVRIRGQDF